MANDIRVLNFYDYWLVTKLKGLEVWPSKINMYGVLIIKWLDRDRCMVRK